MLVIRLGAHVYLRVLYLCVVYNKIKFVISMIVCQLTGVIGSILTLGYLSDVISKIQEWTNETEGNLNYQFLRKDSKGNQFFWYLLNHVFYCSDFIATH